MAVGITVVNLFEEVMYVGSWRGGRLWVMAADAYSAGVHGFKSHPLHFYK